MAQDIVFLGTVFKFSLKMLFSYVLLLIFNCLTYALLNLLFDLASIKMIWKNIICLTINLFSNLYDSHENIVEHLKS